MGRVLLRCNLGCIRRFAASEFAMRKPPFPPVQTTLARVFLGMHPVLNCYGQQLRKGGVLQWKEAWSERRVCGVNGSQPGEQSHAWVERKLRELWSLLPWRDGSIEWSYDPDRRALVVRWDSPVRRGRLLLLEAKVER